MDTITLKNTAPDGETLEAVFLAKLGLNLTSYQKGSLEVIDQSTKEEFENRFSGLGPLIGPHFYHQEDHLISRDFDKSLFPHIERIEKRGQKDPFSHGVGRYVPWNIEHTEQKISATLSSNDTFAGVKLRRLEGCDFHMTFDAHLQPDGLEIAMSVESDRESLTGLHYYYALENRSGILTAPVQHEYNDMGVFKPIPKEWLASDDNFLRFDLSEASDNGYLPLFENFSGYALLETGSRRLKVSFQGENDQISCQVYSPKGASYVCIEPMSAKNPRRLTETKSKFRAKITML